MITMALLRPSKETENKLRWSTHVEEDDAPFHLYIPKWRVPEPWPGRIYVKILRFDNHPSAFAPRPYDAAQVETPIRVLVKPFREHTRTVRYTPLGNPKEWQIGEPYIPFSLIPQESGLLTIEVVWDLDSKGQFIDIPTYRRDWML